MAFGKPLKKTPKAASEVAPKAKASASGTKARASKSVETTNDKPETTSKTRRKTPVVAGVDNATMDSTVAVSTSAIAVPQEVADVQQVSVEVPKTMSASASSAGMGTLAQDGSNSIERPTTSESVTPSSSFTGPASVEAIAQRAYQFWVERGYAHGFAEEDWRRAETELNRR